jgi:ferric-dicitrate binding protein FerR (iron transport regulator)
VHTGETITVPAGSRVSLALTSGIGLRVDQSSTIAFESPVSMRLGHGAVYVETPRNSADPRAAQFSVLTAYGAVRHIGTRFEVRVAPDAVRVRVREGTAAFRTPAGAERTVMAGEQLELQGGALKVTRGPAPTSDAWTWAEAAAPEFRIEGRTLVEALDWFTHESGLHLEFTDEATRSRAGAVVLHGAVTGLAPREAIRAVMMGTTLPYAIDDTRVLVGRR